MKNVKISPNRLPVGSKPRGKPKGSNGATRKIPDKIDRKINVNFSEVEIEKLKAKYKDKITIKEIKRYVWELPIIKLLVTLFVIQRAYVGKKLVAEAVHPELPKAGIFGNNFRAWIISLKNGFAGSYEKISEHIEDLSEESFSEQAINDCVHRTGEELEPEYNKLGKELRESKSTGGDESSWPINGMKYLIWLFCTFNIVFITIEKSRSRKVIAKIFGSFYNGVFTSDCFSVYQGFAKYFQKCWAHLLRTTHHLTKENPKKDIAYLHKWLTILFNEMGEFLKKDPPPDEREKKYKFYNRKLRKIMNHNWKSKQAKGIIKNWFRKFEGHWLTAILISGVKLTNNDTERHLRGSIPTRKLLGGHRTEEGAKYFAITESLRRTWRLRKLSPFHEMANKLREISGNQAL